MMYDIHAALDVGKRDIQEDAVAFGLHEDMNPGFVVVADGMGGHVEGSTASGLAVRSVREDLANRVEVGLPEKEEIPNLLHHITPRANASIATYVQHNEQASGMGTTLVVPVLNGSHLHWASVGDSPLYLYRDGCLKRINEDHSLAPQLDFLVSAGLMDADVARTHPDRSALTSALVGREIPKIDCGTAPIDLLEGDIVIASSDGLLFLTDELICGVLARNAARNSEVITEALMSEIRELDHPTQDNVSIVVIKVADPGS